MSLTTDLPERNRSIDYQEMGNEYKQTIKEVVGENKELFSTTFLRN